MKKTTLVLSIIFSLLVGFIAGYFIEKKNCSQGNGSNLEQLTSNNGNILNAEASAELSNTYTNNSFALSDEPKSHHISDSLSRILIAEFQTQNNGAIFPLRSSNGNRGRLNGYYIDRGPLDTILKDKTLAGISVYFAKDSTAHVLRKTNRTYTLIFMGARLNTANKSTNGVNTTYVNDTPNGAYDFISPCPDVCGNFVVDPTTPGYSKN